VTAQTVAGKTGLATPTSFLQGRDCISAWFDIAHQPSLNDVTPIRHCFRSELTLLLFFNVSLSAGKKSDTFFSLRKKKHYLLGFLLLARAENIWSLSQVEMWSLSDGW
jgi:hypothetical protein